MTNEIKELLLVTLPILSAIITGSIQKWYLAYKTKKFKLIDHPLFTDLVLNNRDLKSWTPAKNRQVFVDALIIKFEIWLEEGEKLAIELQKGHYSNLQLQNKVLKWASKTVDIYTQRWKEQEIPQIVIDRITKVHNEEIESFLAQIKQISFSNDMYPFKMQKIIAIFGTLHLLLADTKNDFNKLVYRDKYNGHFRGTKYKGIPINDDEFQEYIISKSR